jgi:hypothetical protein
MNQKQLLEIAEKKAGSKANLSKMTGLRLAFFYEWEKGVSMKFDVMVSVLEAIGIKLAAYDTESGMTYEFEQLEKEIVSKVKKNKLQSEKKEIKNECDCKIVEGLFRRGKDGCKKSIENHKF